MARVQTILIFTELLCSAYFLKELPTSTLSLDSSEMCGVKNKRVND